MLVDNLTHLRPWPLAVSEPSNYYAGTWIVIRGQLCICCNAHMTSDANSKVDISTRSMILDR